jgi:protein-disulfide isomerase
MSHRKLVVMQIRWIAAALLAACWTSSPPPPAKPAEPPPLLPPPPVVQDRERLQAKIAEIETKIDQVQTTIQNTPPPPPPAPLFGQDPAKTYAISTAHAAFDGPANAKVTMVVAGDYACPYCNKLQQTLRDLRAKYGADLRIAYRSLVVHPRDATAGALASCAADKQNKFAAYDALLWTKGFAARNYDRPQTDPGVPPCWDDANGCAIAIGFAQEVKLDLARFKRDMRGACVTELADTATELASFNVRATPTSYINGRLLSGAQPIATFEQLIDEELAKANERIKNGAKAATYYRDWVIGRGDHP